MKETDVFLLMEKISAKEKISTANHAMLFDKSRCVNVMTRIVATYT